MSQPRMHEDDVATDRELVGRLLASQHPHWADLPIEREKISAIKAVLEAAS